MPMHASVDSWVATLSALPVVSSHASSARSKARMKSGSNIWPSIRRHYRRKKRSTAKIERKIMISARNKVPSWQRGSWRSQLLFQRICELHDAEYLCSMAGFYWDAAASNQIYCWREDAKQWFEEENLDKCQHACEQAEIEMCKAKRILRAEYEAAAMIDDSDLPPGRYGLTRRETFIGDRLHRQISLEQDLEKAIAPFTSEAITRVLLRCRNLFDQAHKFCQWNDYERANEIADLVDGCLRELKALIRNTPSRQIAERLFEP